MPAESPDALMKKLRDAVQEKGDGLHFVMCSPAMDRSDLFWQRLPAAGISPAGSVLQPAFNELRTAGCLPAPDWSCRRFWMVKHHRPRCE